MWLLYTHSLKNDVCSTLARNIKKENQEIHLTNPHKTYMCTTHIHKSRTPLAGFNLDMCPLGGKINNCRNLVGGGGGGAHLAGQERDC